MNPSMQAIDGRKKLRTSLPHWHQPPFHTGTRIRTEQTGFNRPLKNIFEVADARQLTTLLKDMLQTIKIPGKIVCNL